MVFSKKEIGDEGERRALEFLLQCGYTVIANNWHTRLGEIDLIAKKAETLVFFEVKTWPKGTVSNLEYALGPKKQKRIIETSKRFLNKHRQYNDSIIRFDVLLIDMPGFDPIYHIENAFSENI